EAEQLLLGLGEGAVDDQRRLLGLAQRGGGRGRQLAQGGAQLAGLGQALADDGELVHHRLVLFLAPGPDDILIVVAKYRILHEGLPGLAIGRTTMPAADRAEKKIS